MSENEKTITTLTPIQLARVIGRTPQQVYGWIRNNAIPATIISYTPEGHPILARDAAVKWARARISQHYSGRDTRKEKVEMAIAALESFEDESSKLAADLLKKWVAAR